MRAGVMRDPRPSRLAQVLNAALGLELADFDEARAFLLSYEGSDMLDAWLACHSDDDQPPQAEDPAS
jgi:hypothetical protein